MEKVIADTGFVVALTNKNDNRHLDVKNIYLQQNQIILPQTVLAEVAYLIGRDAGIKILVKFLQGLSKSKFNLTSLTNQDLLISANILETYQDSRIDFVDATVMAMAENRNITTILTIDQRDFRLFKPNHCQSFIILP